MRILFFHCTCSLPRKNCHEITQPKSSTANTKREVWCSGQVIEYGSKARTCQKTKFSFLEQKGSFLESERLTIFDGIHRFE